MNSLFQLICFGIPPIKFMKGIAITDLILALLIFILTIHEIQQIPNDNNNVVIPKAHRATNATVGIDETFHFHGKEISDKNMNADGIRYMMWALMKLVFEVYMSRQLFYAAKNKKRSLLRRWFWSRMNLISFTSIVHMVEVFWIPSQPNDLLSSLILMYRGYEVIVMHIFRLELLRLRV